MPVPPLATDSFAAAKEFLDAYRPGGDWAEEPFTAEYLDDDETTHIVVIRDAKGRHVMTTSEEAFFEARGEPIPSRG